MSEEDFQAAFELTLLSSFRMIKAALPHMPNGGSILTVTSGSVREPIARLGLSTIMRAGVAGMVKTWLMSWRAMASASTTLIPGRIDTDRVAQLDAVTSEKTGLQHGRSEARAIAGIPLGRYGTIDDFRRGRRFPALAGGQLYHRRDPARRWRGDAVDLVGTSGRPNGSPLRGLSGSEECV